MTLKQILTLWVSLFLIYFSTIVLALVPMNDFFAHGPIAGDSMIPTGDDNFVNVTLKGGNTFKFFNTSYTLFFVNTNGRISFLEGVKAYTPECGPLPVPLIIPYWADVNTQKGGNVYYRESTDDAILTKAEIEITKAFPTIQNLKIDWVFIATWKDVAFYSNCTPIDQVDVRNTFQLILARSGPSLSSGSKSFALFFFNEVIWTTGGYSGGDCQGLGGTAAKSGFDLGDGKTFFSLPGTCTPAILEVTRTSNVGEGGKWIFRIDESFEPSVVDQSNSVVVNNQTIKTLPAALSGETKKFDIDCKKILVHILRKGVKCLMQISDHLMNQLSSCKFWLF